MELSYCRIVITGELWNLDVTDMRVHYAEIVSVWTYYFLSKYRVTQKLEERREEKKKEEEQVEYNLIFSIASLS